MNSGGLAGCKRLDPARVVQSQLSQSVATVQKVEKQIWIDLVETGTL